MNCNISDDYIMKHFDGNINDIESAQLKQHLKTCTKCNESFKSMEEIVGLLENDNVIEPPKDFEEKVMAKVTSLELVRKKESDRVTTIMYVITTAILIAMSLILVARVEEINIPDIFIKISDSFSSISGTAETFKGLVSNLFTLIKGVTEALLQITFIIIKAYYYIFIAIGMMLFIGQKMFMNIVKHENGGAR
jgi:hypothetical protein